jgi:hypothetical protein
MRLRALLLFVLQAACTQAEPVPTAASAEPSAAPVLDIDGFCEKAVGVGRPCQGDDELLEGNKVGLCTTTLREAGVALDPSLAPACLTAVAEGKPLPDLRTLELLVARFEPCRKLLAPIASLAKVEARPAGRAAQGQPCAASADCAHGLFCTGTESKKSCAAQKKAGERCVKNDECLGRCSAQADKQCVSYCGSG